MTKNTQKNQLSGPLFSLTSIVHWILVRFLKMTTLHEIQESYNEKIHRKTKIAVKM